MTHRVGRRCNCRSWLIEIPRLKELDPFFPIAITAPISEQSWLTIPPGIRAGGPYPTIRQQQRYAMVYSRHCGFSRYRPPTPGRRIKYLRKSHTIEEVTGPAFG